MKEEKPSYEKILRSYLNKSTPVYEAHELAAEEYAKQCVEYHKPKPILVIRGKLDLQTAQNIAKSLEPDYYVLVMYDDIKTPTHELVSQEDATPDQKEAIQQIIDNQK